MQKVNIKGYSIQKLDWKQTNGGDCITSHANTVHNYNVIRNMWKL